MVQDCTGLTGNRCGTRLQPDMKTMDVAMAVKYVNDMNWQSTQLNDWLPATVMWLA